MIKIMTFQLQFILQILNKDAQALLLLLLLQQQVLLLLLGGLWIISIMLMITLFLSMKKKMQMKKKKDGVTMNMMFLELNGCLVLNLKVQLLLTVVTMDCGGNIIIIELSMIMIMMILSFLKHDYQSQHLIMHMVLTNTNH